MFLLLSAVAVMLLLRQILEEHISKTEQYNYITEDNQWETRTKERRKTVSGTGFINQKHITSANLVASVIVFGAVAAKTDIA